MRGRLVRGVAAIAAALLLAACSGSQAPPPPPTSAVTSATPACDPAALADWSRRGFAVLRQDTSVFGVDIRDGAVKVRCPLPPVRPSSGLTMATGGIRFSETQQYSTQVLLRTQWLSPDFRWSTSATAPLFELSSGRDVPVTVPGKITAVSSNTALVSNDVDGRPSWCVMPLPPQGDTCRTLPESGPEGGYVFDQRGQPQWLPVEATSIPVGGHTAYVLTDGQRIYHASLFPPARATASAAADPAGQGFFAIGADLPPGITTNDWVTVEGGRATVRRSTGIPPGDVHTRAIISGGGAAVLGYWNAEKGISFVSVAEGSAIVTALRPRCDKGCDVLAWPGSAP